MTEQLACSPAFPAYCQEGVSTSFFGFRMVYSAYNSLLQNRIYQRSTGRYQVVSKAHSASLTTTLSFDSSLNLSASSAEVSRSISQTRRESLVVTSRVALMGRKTNKVYRLMRVRLMSQGSSSSIITLTAVTDQSNFAIYNSSSYAAKAPPVLSNVTLTPFIGDQTNTSAVALATLPAQLPDVAQAPNILLASTTVQTTIAGSATQIAQLVALPATASSFTFTGQSAGQFPTQTESFPIATSTSATSPLGTATGADGPASTTQSRPASAERQSHNVLLVGLVAALLSSGFV